MKKHIYLTVTIVFSILFLFTVISLIYSMFSMIFSITSHSGEDMAYTIGTVIGQLIIVIVLGLCVRYFKKKYRLGLDKIQNKRYLT